MIGKPFHTHFLSTGNFMQKLNPETHTMTEVLDYACTNIPEKWIITVQIERDSLIYELCDPSGEHIPIENDEMNNEESMEAEVNYARNEEGIDPVYMEKKQLDTDY